MEEPQIVIVIVNALIHYTLHIGQVIIQLKIYAALGDGAAEAMITCTLYKTFWRTSGSYKFVNIGIL